MEIQVGDMKIGMIYEDEPSIYGQYFYNKITKIVETKAGRVKIYVSCKYKDNDGIVTEQHNCAIFNGAKKKKSYNKHTKTSVNILLECNHD